MYVIFKPALYKFLKLKNVNNKNKFHIGTVNIIILSWKYTYPHIILISKFKVEHISQTSPLVQTKI